MKSQVNHSFTENKTVGNLLVQREKYSVSVIKDPNWDPSLPAIILATSNGVGMGHLARATAIAQTLVDNANVVIFSMAGAVAEVGEATSIPFEYVPGRDRQWMPGIKWDAYLRDRLVALIDETKAEVLCFDGVVPYPGLIAAKNLRPRVKLVWMRRGMWQSTAQRHLLPLHRHLMDSIIEPGDFAASYDNGPTASRRDATLISPISLYRFDRTMTRTKARVRLGLHPLKPAVLVQLGMGDVDLNLKVKAALEGLLGWRGIQVVMTKNPIDATGKSLAPQGLDIKVIRHFPLAEVIHAFDAAIAAAGYNSVHELLPAGIPTVLIPNDRGTDNQGARARWCADHGYSLYADSEKTSEITRVVRLLRDANVRSRLVSATTYLPALSGASEAAQLLLEDCQEQKNRLRFRSNYLRYLIKTRLIRRVRAIAFSALRHLALLYRYFKPRLGVTETSLDLGPPIFSNSQIASDLVPLIKGSRPLEHLIAGASLDYLATRSSIAQQAYQVEVAVEIDLTSEFSKTIILENSTN